MILPHAFYEFAKECPATLMMRGILEYALPAADIDQLFRENAQSQSQRELLFSCVVDLLSQVVIGMHSSVNAAHNAKAARNAGQSSSQIISVTVKSLYDKMAKCEPQTTQALVRFSAERLRPILQGMNAVADPLMEDYVTKIIDGKHLKGTEHRLPETWTISSKPLPGHLLVVLDPALSLSIDAFPCEDAYTSERALLPEVLETVQKNDLWIGDRHFCTTDFLFGIARRDGFFVIRQHKSTLSGKRLCGEKQSIGHTKTGEVYEQTLEITDPKTEQTMSLRRITIELNERTRNGEKEVHLVTNLPETKNALQLADLYLNRWLVENLFGEISQCFQGEIKALCYPRAALLCYCVALLTSNVVSVLKSVIAAVHGDRALLQSLSSFYLAEEIRGTYRGMMIALSPNKWSRLIGKKTQAEVIALLKEIASQVKLTRYKKRVRGPRKPPKKRTGGLTKKHVSIKRLIDQRR